MKYSGDRNRSHPYLNPLFWIDPANQNEIENRNYHVWVKFFEQMKEEAHQTGKIDLI